MNIEIISGSPRAHSVTHRIALFLLKELGSRTQHHVGLIDVREPQFPMIQVPFSSVEKAPEALRPIAERMFAADAFVIVTPEYNGGYSPAMKNLFDHFPKQMHKAFGIVTGSDGIMGGIRASQQVQLMVNGLMGIASPVMLITPLMDKKFDAEGNLLDESFMGKADTFIEEFLWLAERIEARG
jgi:NAD(P)H-dependent FMN reductase